MNLDFLGFDRFREDFEIYVGISVHKQYNLFDKTFIVGFLQRTSAAGHGPTFGRWPLPA